MTSASSRDGYSAISQDEQERLLEDEPDSEEEDENNRRNLANQERAWRDQASSSKAGKVYFVEITMQLLSLLISRLNLFPGVGH